MSNTRARFLLLFIVLLFVAPVFIALLMHSEWWDYRPDDMTNHGALVEPVLPIDFARMRFTNPSATPPKGRWTVLYPVPAECRNRCMSDITALRQIHRAAGRHQEHLAVLLLLPSRATFTLRNRLRAVYDVFLLAEDRNGSVAMVLRSAADGYLQDGQAFLVDPAGNIMMRYAAGFAPGDLNKDLKRLLKWSSQDG